MTDESYVKKSPNASRIGKAVEHLVAASCILASGAVLNVSTSLVDDEGVDLVFHRRDSTNSLAAQVKSRSSDTTQARRGQFSAFVRRQTFRERDDLYLLFVLVDRSSALFGPVWLIPSAAFARSALATGKGAYRFNASLKPDTNDQWRPYRLAGDDVPRQLSQRLLELLGDDSGSER